MKKTVIFDLICDRQDLIGYMAARKLGLEPYMLDRTDMYWAHVNVEDDHLKAEVCFCVDPEVSRQGPAGVETWHWGLSRQWGSKLLSLSDIESFVLLEFARSLEGVKADGWMRLLVDAGYFDHGRAYSPNTNAARCKHCGYLFEKGTSHPHTWIDDHWNPGKKKLTYHHWILEEKKIKELGLTKLGVSGLSDVPSLEELGELEPYTVQ